ncbi:MAG: NifB/NifX family molybdenum-iron cluster-binding protein [Desulfuromonadaceae bacterium]|nr:NifB/NifX family molybdenum-iron cluster-binding protein [Desulfuromonadaceae bacterium]
MSSKTVHIAIPCYDSRVFPRFDGASTFCVFDADFDSGTYSFKEERVCPQGEDTCTWLAQQHINGVVCSGIQREYQIKLDRLGIWLVWGVSGPLTQAISQCLRQPPEKVATEFSFLKDAEV